MNNGEQLRIGPFHRQWLDEHALALQLNNAALHTFASERGVKIDADPSVYVDDLFHTLPVDESKLVVHWTRPGEPLTLTEYRLSLINAVSVTLGRVRQEAQRQKARRWGGIGTLLGFFVSTVGPAVAEQDSVVIAGGALFAGGLTYITWAYNRNDPKPINHSLRDGLPLDIVSTDSELP